MMLHLKHTSVRVAPGREVRLCRVRVEDINILVEEQLHKLGRFQEFPLAAKDAGSLFWRVQHPAARQGENHHEGVLHNDTGRRTRAHVERHMHTSEPSHRHTQKQ